VETAAGEMVVLDWRYNAWGGKYPPWDDDDRARVRIAELLGLRYYSPGFILEGGALDVNGRGTLLTCELCVLNANRNPALTRTEAERQLKQCLGVSKVLWLARGLAGDETDGHIDILARFLDPTTVMVLVEEDPKSENYEPLQDNYRRLQSMTDQDGRPLRVIPLPLPRPTRYKHLLLPASYANFYIANNVVLVPTYNDPNDRKAMELLSRFFPTRQLAPIDSSQLLIGGGAIHCVTQQQPAGRKK
jgi:agmatine deiminase